MDAYLECPQNYIEEHLLEGPSPYLTEYHCIRSKAGRADGRTGRIMGSVPDHSPSGPVFGRRHDIREGGGVREMDGPQLIRP